MPHSGHAPKADGRRKSGSPPGEHQSRGHGRPSGKAIPKALAGPDAADHCTLPAGRQLMHQARP
eukprot:11421685-Alexandrium_andersonii.AAC.1